MEEIETFIQEHVGEYSFKCEGCGNIVNTQGLPHWAISKQIEPTGEKTYFIFSPEMWYSYEKGILPLHMIAFLLRTSVEGVLITATRRGEKNTKIDESVLLREEKKSKQLLLAFGKTRTW